MGVQILKNEDIVKLRRLTSMKISDFGSGALHSFWGFSRVGIGRQKCRTALKLIIQFALLNRSENFWLYSVASTSYEISVLIRSDSFCRDLSRKL